jgi:hypothetical protein
VLGFYRLDDGVTETVGEAAVAPFQDRAVEDLPGIVAAGRAIRI